MNNLKKKNLLKLNVFFEALNYETIQQQKAYTLSDLLGFYCFLSLITRQFTKGDVGGQMGLFIGCSTLTLLEVFDYFYDIFKVNLVFSHLTLTTL